MKNLFYYQVLREVCRSLNIRYRGSLNVFVIEPNSNQPPKLFSDDKWKDLNGKTRASIRYSIGEKWLDAEIEKVRKIALEDIDNIKSAFVNSYPYNQNYKPRK